MSLQSQDWRDIAFWVISAIEIVGMLYEIEEASRFRFLVFRH